MTQPTNVVSVIINESSGSASEKLRSDIQRAFDAQGVGVRWLPVSRRELARLGQRAFEDRVRESKGVVCVAGGDGTVNAVASACAKLKRPLGILPAGTFNYVARNLGLPFDMNEAAKIIVAGRAEHVPVGEINGHLFLNNAGFGLYGEMVERREQAKQKFGRHRVVAFMSGLRCLLERHPVYTIHVATDGKEHILRTTTLFFGVNALQLQNYNIDSAKYVERGKLAVLSLRLDSRWDIAKMAWAALHGKVEAAEPVDATAATSIRVTTRRRAKMKVAIDGEIIHMKAPLTVKVLHDALQIMLPEPQPEQQAAKEALEETPLEPAPELNAQSN
jgi:diacylglycerol kinase family enzyme